MSKFCGKCGAELPDEAMFCNVCGENFTVTPEEPVAVNGGNALVNKVMEYKKYFVPGAIALVAIILVIVLISSLAGSGYKRAAKNYINGTLKGKYSAYEKMYPKEVWDYMEENVSEDILDEDYFEDNYEDMIDYLEEEYGKDIKISYKITDKDKLDEDDLKDLRDSLKDTYDMAKKDVTAAYELELEVTVKGDDDEDTNDMDIVVYKYDGKWYVQG